MQHTHFLRLLALLRAGTTTRNAAEQLGVSQKSVLRMYAELRQAGFILAHRAEDHGRRVWCCVNLTDTLTRHIEGPTP